MLVFLLIWKTAMDSFNGFSKICHIACMVNTSWSGQTLFGSSIVTSNKHYVCIVLEVFLSFLLKKSLNAENIKSFVSTRDRERRNSLCKHVFLNGWNLEYIHRRFYFLHHILLLSKCTSIIDILFHIIRRYFSKG